VKKEISTSKRRALKALDRRRLELSVSKHANRGLRMLCAGELLDLQIDCPVNTTANEFACAQINDIRLDIGAIQDMIQPILGKLVNAEETGAFDQVGVPLLEFDNPIPGIKEVKEITFVDIAEALVGKDSGVDTVRQVLKLYRGMKTLAEIFASTNDDGILLAESCQFKPSSRTKIDCTGGAT
jgi:hypothetical protein